jgi:hypothetical protein
VNQKQEHECGWDCSSVHSTKIVTITWIDEQGRTQKRGVCPCCVNHPQGEVNEVLDCKNVFWEGYRYDKHEERTIRKSIGQCMCYSELHGKRTRKY